MSDQTISEFVVNDLFGICAKHHMHVQYAIQQQKTRIQAKETCSIAFPESLLMLLF